MHILTGNEDVTYRDSISSPGMHIVYPGCFLTMTLTIFFHFMTKVGPSKFGTWPFEAAALRLDVDSFSVNYICTLNFKGKSDIDH